MIEQLHKQYTYDPDTGILTWKIGRNKGKQCGWSSGKYRQVWIDGKKQYVHRVIFAMVVGRYPEEIDHINRDGHDNRWCNLREVDRHTNMQNRGTQKNSPFGVKGVEQHGNRFAARRQYKGVRMYLGMFDSVAEAAEAYENAIQEQEGQKLP